MLARLTAIAAGVTIGVGALVGFAHTTATPAPTSTLTPVIGTATAEPEGHTSTACLYERYWTAEGCPGVSWVISKAQEDAEAAAEASPSPTSTTAPKPSATPSKPAPRPSKPAPKPSATPSAPAPRC